MAGILFPEIEFSLHSSGFWKMALSRQFPRLLATSLALLGLACCLNKTPQAAAAEPPIKVGLVLHLAADGQIISEGTKITQWNDATIKQNHAKRDLDGGKIPDGNPKLVDDGKGHKLLRFSGTHGAFTFTRISDIRAVFWVLSRDVKASHTGPERFVMGDTKTKHFFPGGHNQDFIFHPAESHANIRQGKTYLNGSVVNPTTTDFPKTLSIISIHPIGNVEADGISKNAEFSAACSWYGDIAEVLVYNRALSDDERRLVESFLGTKYGIELPFTMGISRNSFAKKPITTSILTLTTNRLFGLQTLIGRSVQTHNFPNNASSKSLLGDTRNKAELDVFETGAGVFDQ